MLKGKKCILILSTRGVVLCSGMTHFDTFGQLHSYVYNSIQFNIYCIKYSHIINNTVTKKNHEFSEEVNAK